MFALSLEATARSSANAKISRMSASSEIDQEHVVDQSEEDGRQRTTLLYSSLDSDGSAGALTQNWEN